MDNKELPQEIINEIIGLAIREIDLGYHDGSELPAFADGLGKGAQIAQSQYDPIIQSKDATIKELTNQLEAATENYGDALVKIEKLMGAFKEVYTEFGVSDEDFDYWLEQHGI